MNRILTRLIGLFLITLLIPTTVITLYGSATITTQVTENTSLSANQTSKLIASAIENALGRAQSDTVLIARTTAATDYADALDSNDPVTIDKALVALQTSLLSYAENLGQYNHISFIDSKGHQVVLTTLLSPATAAQPALASLNSSAITIDTQTDYLRQTLSATPGQVVTSAVFLDTTRGKFTTPYKPIIRFSVPVTSKFGNNNGIIVLDLLAKPVFALAQSSPDPTSSIYILDTDGTYLVNPSSDTQLYGRDLKTSVNFLKDHPKDGNSVLAGKAPFESSDNSDILQVATTLNITTAPTLHWTIYYTLARSTALSSVNRNNILIFAIAGFTMLIALISALFAATSITGPIVALTRISAEIATVPEPGSTTFNQTLHTNIDKISRQRIATAPVEVRTLQSTILAVLNNLAHEIDQRQESATLATELAQVTSFSSLTRVLGGTPQRQSYFPAPQQVIKDANGQIIVPLRSGDALVWVHDQPTHSLQLLNTQLSTVQALVSEIDARLQREEANNVLRQREEKLEQLVRLAVTIGSAMGTNNIIKEIVDQTQAVYPTWSVHAALDGSLARPLQNHQRSWEVRATDLLPEDEAILKLMDQIFESIFDRNDLLGQREVLIKDLQAAKRIAEENSRLKSEFLSTMSHELRTPLNAIEGFAGIIITRSGGADFNAKTEEYLTRIRVNSKRLLQLINDFLDLSRIESGRLEFANLPFSLDLLAKRWRDEISILAERKGLQFELSYDDTLPETIFGDEEALSKVTLNLLSNAIKFTEQGRIKLNLERNGQETVLISVEDTGIGIPPHAREYIFDEFRQVDQTSRRKYGGTGLGLAIVQKYTRAMGGTVQLKSELGKGSVFVITLPLQTTP